MERSYRSETTDLRESAHLRTVIATTAWLNLMALGAGIFIVAAIALFAGDATPLVAIPALVVGGLLAVYACGKVAPGETTSAPLPPPGATQRRGALRSLRSSLSAAPSHPEPAARR